MKMIIGMFWLIEIFTIEYAEEVLSGIEEKACCIQLCPKEI